MEEMNIEKYDLKEVRDLNDKFNDLKYIENTGLIFSNIEMYKTGVEIDIYLKNIAESLTADSIDKLSKIKKIVFFVQTTIRHPFLPMEDEFKQMIFNPLIILDLKMGQCGQSNRLLVDLLIALGFEARLLQLNGHIAASVKFNGEWRFLDADSLSHGQIIKNQKNEIATVKDVLTNPIITMNTLINIKNSVFLQRFSSPSTYQELKVFQKAFFIEKNISDKNFNTSGRYYGWNYTRNRRI